MGWRGVTVGLLLLQALLGSCAFAEDQEFAFVFPCDPRKNAVCMTTKYRSGQKLCLLGNRTDVCRTETHGTFPFQRGTKEKQLSRIDLAPCPGKTGFFLAYIGDALQGYRRYTGAPVADPEALNRIDAAVKQSKFYSTASEYFGGTLSPRPTCFHPIPGVDNLVVVQYATNKPKGSPEKYGPVYMSVGGEIREIASEASLGNLFVLGDRYYMTYRAGCWQGCGIQAEVLVEITPEGFRKILIDGFFGI